MPEYEYECLECRNIFSVHQMVSEHEKNSGVQCDRCGSTNVRQLLSGPTVITSRKS
jgi:putative FmdB family regulatory protein